MTYIIFLTSFLFFIPLTRKRDISRVCTYFYFVIILFACIRFGVGTDYFAYYVIFSGVPKGNFNVSFFNNANNYLVEPGFYLLAVLSKALNLSFISFMALCAFLSLVTIFYVIQKYSVNKILSLFLFFSYYYLIYIENLIRQGMAMAIFVYAFFRFIKDRKIFSYIMLILFGMTFHVSLAVVLIIPIIIKLNKKMFLEPVSMIMVSIASFILGLAVFRLLIDFVPIVGLRLVAYSESYNMNIFALLIRIIKLFIIYIIYIKMKKNLTQEETMIFIVYIFGFIFYFFVSQISIFSRMTNYFMFIEILLIPIMVKYHSKYEKNFIIFIYIIIFSFMFVKDIESFLHQREYYSKNVLEYNHITIFNKEKIKEVLPRNVSREYFGGN